MNAQSNVPVLVGSGVVQQRIDEVEYCADAASLMSSAIDNAARDAGSRFLVPAAEAMLISRGTWPYSDPTPLLLNRHMPIRSIVADVGVLQQALLSRACEMISSGEAEIVIVCGGEAKYRALQAQRTNQPLIDREELGEPSERMVPEAEIITREEIERGLAVPNRQYAMIDTALRQHQGLSREAHLDLLAANWSAFSKVAATNPDAWLRKHFEPSAFAEHLSSNPLLAWPYTRLHCSQWNVDQAVALIICSTDAARRYGVPTDRWVYAHAAAQSNLMVPLSKRAELHRSPAAAAAGAALKNGIGIDVADVAFRDLYSCFPAAVRVQQAEFGLTSDQSVTVTGGMTFGGGPFNSYTLHALAKMAEVLRNNPHERGVVTMSAAC
jgi:acetyl-CoA C-acetyltransferase